MNNIVFDKDDSVLKIIMNVLSRRKYLIITLISTVILFSILYYFFVYSITGRQLRISIDMDGEFYVGLSLINAAITAFLSGVILSVLTFKFNSYKKFSKKGIFGFVGTGISAFGFGCPTCGAFLFGIFGTPLALMYFPFRGIELQILGIGILLTFTYLTAKSINRCQTIK